MAWFGFGKEEAPAAQEEQEQARRAAVQEEYRKKKEDFPPDAIRLKQEGASAAFPESAYLLACREGEIWLLPDLDVRTADGQALADTAVQRYPRARLEIRKEEPPRIPQTRAGLLDVFAIPPVTLALALDGGAPARFTAANRPHTAQFLEKYLPGCRLRKVYDILDAPDDARTLFCEQGGGLLPDRTPLAVWREEDALCFLRQTQNSYYSSVQDVRFGRLPLAAVEYFEPKGDIDYETRVTGGQVTVDRTAAFLAGLEHPFTWNPHGRAIEAAVRSEPIRTERVENDKRYVEVRVRLHGRRAALRFSYESLAAWEALVPEKSFENQPGLREPTIAEQIEILANVCERGYLTREEFETAKAKLLARL